MDGRHLGAEPGLVAEGRAARKKSLIAATDGLYDFLRRCVEADPDDNLPVAVRLHDQAFAMRVFLMMEAFDWRFLPSQVLAEDAGLMEDLLQMRGLKFTIERALHPPEGPA